MDCCLIRSDDAEGLFPSQKTYPNPDGADDLPDDFSCQATPFAYFVECDKTESNQ